MHYRRWRRTGYPEGESSERRFFRQVKQDVFGCWIWIGSLSTAGYGRFGDESRIFLAHRWAYTFLRADIPPGLNLDHLCRVRACVNPWHLEPVTQGVNIQRSYLTCPNGHEYSEDNTEIHPSRGHRQCRICRLARDARANASV